MVKFLCENYHIMQLDETSPAYVALQMQVKRLVIAGGSFSHWLPNPVNISPKERRITFQTAKENAINQCLRNLVNRVGLRDDVMIRKSLTGERIWPEGFSGSFSHKGTVVLAVIADKKKVSSIGIDVELKDNKDISNIRDLVSPEKCPSGIEPSLGTLIAFSGKEAVYKAQYPLTHRKLEFSDVHISWKETKENCFAAEADCGMPKTFHLQCCLYGQWIVSISVPHGEEIAL